MNGLDYFLYDNRTRSSFGRDWGLKAATGSLSEKSDLRQKFVEYCNLSFDTRGGVLRDFDQALGGLPHQNGYLLCVTFESSDHLGRPACTFVGLWLERRDALNEFLSSYDPFETARSASQGDIPPDQLVPSGAPIASDLSSTTRTALPYGSDGDTATRIFQRSETPRQVADSLLERVRRRQKVVLPRILGITSLREPERLVVAGFDLVFSQSELPRILRSPQTSHTEPALSEERPPNRLKKRLPQFLEVGIVVLLVVGVTWLIWRPAPSPEPKPVIPPPPSGVATEPAPPPVTDPAPEPAPPPSHDRTSVADEEFLRRMEVAFVTLENLDSRQLKTSRVYKILSSVPLPPQNEHHRAELLKALEDLPELRMRLIGTSGENLPYYFKEGPGTQLANAERARIVREKILKLKIPTTPCDDLERAFRFEFQKTDGLPVWCKQLREVRELAMMER